ncbi:MAG: adenylate/guanylate cyclase domain-containing protein [Gammaproteobacteria bacterium]|nr:MAG: adenylate/guanylate cyclase domain-containing protein [Gammaproteobacteria bacterium]
MSITGKRTKLNPIFGFLLVLTIGWGLQSSGMMTTLDNQLLDMQFRFLRDYFPRPVEPEKDVVVIGIDDETRKRLKEPFNLWHHHWGKFLTAIAESEPAVVGLDIVFPVRSYEDILPGFDTALRRGILKARQKTNIVYGVTLNADGTARVMQRRYLLAAGGEQATGWVVWNLDDDRVIRRFNEMLGDQPIVTLSGRMSRILGITPEPGIIDYSIGERFQYIPMIQVLDWYDAGDIKRLRAAFNNRPVLLGSVLPLEDRHYMPVNLAGWEEDNRNRIPGVLSHAQALRSIINSGLIKPVDYQWVLLLTLIAAGLWLGSKNIIFGVTFVTCYILVLMLFSTHLLYTGWFLPSTGLLLIAALAFLGRTTFEATIKVQERQRLRASFGGYISPQIMQEILEGRLQAVLGGERCNICLLFSDIRGFTARTEAMSAEDMIKLLNRYFDKMTMAIHANKGTLDKFMGDGIMAFFGAPNELENPSQNAFDTGRKMLQGLEELNKELETENITPFQIGIGLHQGSAIVGNVGSETRHDYTAIGDTVNVTARLEGLTKVVGYALIVSGSVLQHLGNQQEFESLGKQELKGHTPVEAYGWKPSKVH